MKCDELEVYDMASNAELSAGYDHHWAYDKDEADEAIAELKAEIEDLKNSNYAEMTDLGMANAKLKQQLRKQKRERCLAMAKACHLMLPLRLFPNKEYIRKWVERGNKWIDLADKLKEKK